MHPSTTIRPVRAAALGATALLLALAPLPAAAQQAADVDALIARAATTYKNARTATAKFEQTLTNPMTGTSAVSRGVMTRQSPGKLSFIFTDPKGDRVVADGEHLWV